MGETPRSTMASSQSREARPTFRALGPFADEQALLLRQVQEDILDAAARRRRGPSLAHDFGRDSLGDLGEVARVVHQGDVRVAEDIYKAGADDHARCVYHLARRLCGNASGWRNLQHALTADGDIPVVPGIAGAINDLRAADQNVNVACRHLFTSRFEAGQPRGSLLHFLLFYKYSLSSF